MGSKVTDIEFELVEIPSIKESLGELSKIINDFSNNDLVVSRGFLYRGTSPKPFGLEGNYSVDIFEEKYWGEIQKHYHNLKEVMKLYSKLEKVLKEK